MATYKIGVSTKTRLNALGGAQYKAAQPSTSTSTKAQPTQFWVVSKGFAGRLQGYKKGTSSNGTLYGVFSNQAQASNYQKRNKLTLVTSIIAY